MAARTRARLKAQHRLVVRNRPAVRNLYVVRNRRGQGGAWHPPGPSIPRVGEPDDGEPAVLCVFCNTSALFGRLLSHGTSAHG